MNKTGWALALVGILIIVAAIILFVLPGHTKAPTVDGTASTTKAATTGETPATSPDVINLNIKNPDGHISSPFTLTGSVRGNWYFEASFGVQLKSSSGAVIATVPATATSDWMTSAYVPFKAGLVFPAQPAGSKGTLVLRKDNPSGLPENDQALIIPVVF